MLRAGFLADRYVTTSRGWHEEFRPLVREVIDERVVDDAARRPDQARDHVQDDLNPEEAGA